MEPTGNEGTSDAGQVVVEGERQKGHLPELPAREAAPLKTSPSIKMDYIIVFQKCLSPFLVFQKPHSIVLVW